MGNYENLKQSITEVIRTNGNQEITGAVLQSTLLTIISTVGANATFAGIATPTTNPGTPDGSVFWIASESGTYSNFGSIELQDGLSILMWNGSWRSQQIFGVDDVPTSGSDNLVKSGGVYNNIGALDISELNATENPHTLATYEDLASALNALPISYRKGGMSVKFVQSFDNKYVQFRLMADDFTTNIAYWQSVNTDNNWAVASRALITFPSSTQITIGSGNIYLYKGTKYVAIIRSAEETFTLDGTKFLALSLGSQNISVKSSIEDNDVVLIFHDGAKGFCDGLLYNIYQNAVINNTISELSNNLPSIPYIGYFSKGTASVDSNRILSISGFDLFSNKRSFDRINGTKTVQLATGSDVIWFDLSTKEFSVSTNYNSNSVLVGVCLANNGNVILNGIKCVDFQNDLKYDILDKKNVKQLSLLADVPQEIIDSAIDAKGRIDTWRGSNEVVLCGQVTDLHANRNIDTCKALEQLTAINTLLNCDVLVNGGDIGIERANSDYIASVLLSRSIKYMDSSLVWLFCKGNHDYRSSINQLSLANALNKPIVCNHDIGYNRDNGDVSYGYYDQTRLKIRFIYINTSEGDTNNYTMSQTQVEWIINALQSAASGYGIVVLSHMCIDEIGRWNSYPDDASADCFVVLRNVFKDFVAKTSGSGTINGNTISWDFSSAQGSLVCVLSGDSHFDNYIKRDGVNYIVRQGYGTISSSELPQGAVYQDENIWLNKYKKCCFDILAVNKGGGAKIFRIGIGGADRDLAFTY